MSTLRLFHYTCGHSLDGIQESRFLLRPWGAPGRPQLVWLTDLDFPDREGLGLTSRLIACDRTRYRFTVHPQSATPVEHWSTARRRFRPTYVEALEKARGAKPEHWWISREPVPVDATSLSELLTTGGAA